MSRTRVRVAGAWVDVGVMGPPGDPGDDGDPGPPGDPGLNFRDAWDIATAYVADDVVTRSGESWVSVAPSTGIDPAVALGYTNRLLQPDTDNGAYGDTSAQRMATGFVPGATVVIDRIGFYHSGSGIGAGTVTVGITGALTSTADLNAATFLSSGTIAHSAIVAGWNYVNITPITVTVGVERSVMITGPIGILGGMYCGFTPFTGLTGGTVTTLRTSAGTYVAQNRTDYVMTFVLQSAPVVVWSKLAAKGADAVRGPVTINDQTGTTYTLALADATKWVRLNNAGAITLTVPPNSSVAFPVGTQIEGNQAGAGQVTIAPGSGVTVNGTPGLKVAAQYGVFGLLKVATDTWLAYGRLSA